MNEIPIARGLFICERVESDPLSRNPTLVNRFTIIRADEFPTQPRPLSVFAALTNGFGDISIRLVVTHLESDTELFRYSEFARFTDRLREVPVLLTIRELVIPEVGTYEFALYADNEPLTQCRLRAAYRSTGEST